MKNVLGLLLVCILLTGCTQVSPVSLVEPTNIENPLPLFTSTITQKPTFTTISPTNTPLREISDYDIGLPYDTALVKDAKYIPCYVFTATHFHAGDMIKIPNDGNAYYVLAPSDGKIVTAHFINDTVGYEISIETPYLDNGEKVYIDIVHSSGTVGGLKMGSSIIKGDPIAVLTKPYGVPPQDPDQWFLIDIGIRRGSHKQANPELEGWSGLEYFSFFDYVKDDLDLLLPNEYSLMPVCSGNPIKQQIPYSTPTLESP